MSYHWNWGVFASPAPTGDTTYLGWLFSGLEMTLVLSLVAWMLALVVGILMGILRTLPGRGVSAFAAAYVELFRNIPLLVQLFIWYFVLPELLPPALGTAIKQMNPAWQQFLAAVICLGMFTSARVCEQVRAGIEALPREQKSAALALGLNLPQAYRHVLLPMALRLIVPPLTSEMLNLVKNSSVCSTIGLLELAAEGRQLVDYTSQPYESFIAVTLAYVLVNVFVMALMHRVEVRSRIVGYMSRS